MDLNKVILKISSLGFSLLVLISFPQIGKTENAVVADDYQNDEAIVIINDSQQQERPKDFTGIIQQSTDYSCGAASLATLINILGGTTTEKEIMELTNTTSENGTTMKNLKIAAGFKGYQAIGLRVPASDLLQMKPPFLIRTEALEGIDHFQIIKNINKTTVFVADTSEGNLELNYDDFTKEYKGQALFILLPGETLSLPSLGVELTDEELQSYSGKWLPLAARMVAWLTGTVATKHFAVRLAERGISWWKAVNVFKNGSLYFDEVTNNLVRFKDNIAIVFSDSRLITIFKTSHIPQKWLPW